MLVVNLSHVSSKPTGLSNYATNVVPYMHDLRPTLLSSLQTVQGQYYPIPVGMGPEYGAKGHIKRLAWTQYVLPKICERLGSGLLFSPIPEAPLGSQLRYVVTAHDLIPLRFSPRASRLRLYFRYYVGSVLKSADHILCNSQSTATELTNFYGFHESKMTVTPLAHNDSLFTPLSLPTKNYFLYVGRHDIHKNLIRLVEAFAKVAMHQDYELWLVGSQHRQYSANIHQRADELAVSKKVKLIDYLPDSQINEVVNQAIALVFPSLWEGFGLPVLEAMACGTPVITSNISALSEVAGDAAILVNPYSVDEIADAMRMVATDSRLRDRLRETGLERSRQFSWEKTGKKTVEALQRFI
ncbi:MAG: mannosyltransferase [Leptolyngbya foveolarum]|uniref:Mannosyltransferase n=1 Tax=Leptolyngbya foveolarum TaxID=47253 RepID=A0A2W4UHH5_9CYAN|nr:MAG: mannosyltransferase [Leptolyngbya foveolarum]